jgi:Zn finger protein HypA/HybF involved in hydrogenase expression
MPLDDPATWIKGATALKTAFDSVRSAISMVRDVRALGGGSPQQQKAIDTALSVASSNTVIAEAELAKAFGYELCKCDFPPTPMLTVGYFNWNHGANKKEGDPVYECPKCGYNTAGPFNYQSITEKKK